MGSTANPSQLVIALCGYGPQIPRVNGTAVIARTGPVYINSTSGSFTTELYGNDAITPSGTYYAITVLDPKGNVVQCGAYRLDEGSDYDLSTLAPLINPTYSTPQAYHRLASASGDLLLNASGWVGPITFDLTLTGDVTSSQVIGLIPGQRVQWCIRQDATGNRAWAWPATVKNPPPINPAASSVSTADFFVDFAGNLYPANGWS